jgi:hypothetical protein
VGLKSNLQGFSRRYAVEGSIQHRIVAAEPQDIRRQKCPKDPCRALFAANGKGKGCCHLILVGWLVGGKYKIFSWALDKKNIMPASIKPKTPRSRVGNRWQVYTGKAFCTSGGLTQKDLTTNKWGDIVSKKMQQRGRALYKKYRDVMEENRAPPFRSRR